MGSMQLVDELKVGKEVMASGAFTTEVLYTFMLCYVVLNVARYRCNEGFGLAIGFVIVAGGYANSGGVSGGAFNPAVASLAPMTSTMPKYMAAEFLGAALAAGAAMFVTNGSEMTGAFDAPLPQKLVSEFIGTFMLVATVYFNVSEGSTAGALSIGMCLSCMIYATGHVSGGQYNPAVSIAVMARMKQDGVTTLSYIVTQFIAGGAAGLLCAFTLSETKFSTMGSRPADMKAGIVEAIFTFVLCFVVLCVATVRTPSSPSYNALAIGLCVVAGGNAAGVVSGGVLNPAVSFGLSLGAGDFSAIGPHIVGQFVGGLVAAGMFFAIYMDELKADARESNYKLLDA